MNNSTQLVSATGYDVKNMIFSEPLGGTIPDSKPAINFSRIMISTKNKDGTEGELILPTTELFTFGVGENLNQETGKVNGYVLPLCLHNKNGPSADEEAFVETFNNIVDNCKKYLIENKETLGQYELEMNDLKKFNPLYYKREKGKIVEGSGPTLYGKLITSKKNGIITKFYDAATGEILNPLDLLGTYSFAKAAIKFESIFIGNKISLQVKVYECDIRPSNTGMKRLLKRPESDSRILNKVPEKSIPYSIDDDDSGSIVNSDIDEDISSYIKEEVKPAPTKVVKKVIKKVVKKDYY
jgi:Protein of unknown function (DUF2738)